MDDIFTQCREGNSVAVRLWLDNTENDLNLGDHHGFSPLHWACREGRGPLDLVTCDAQVCLCNRYGQTPLDKAKPHLQQLLQGNGTLNKQAGVDFKQLSLLAKINENHSGELWQGRWQGEEIVVKVLQVRDWTTRKSRDFNEEHPKLRIFSHPNILPVLGACQAPPSPHPIIISHYMPYGGMAFLHTLEPMVSRLYLNSKHVMLSFQCPGRSYAPAWLAPEALQKRPEDINRRSADMWSFAVLLWELVTREVPFADLSQMEIGMKGLRPTIPPGISPHVCKLMRLCMNEDPAKRPKFDIRAPNGQIW
ncbi:hypothetical protein CRUP_004614 [Coryphaenoides rupestris]|nr:hypothetical protein CRUP_004614 [Coryphaenoides rupestris]